MTELDRQYSWPEGHWNWPIPVTHKHGLRCGDMIWVGGQVDLSSDGRVLNQGSLERQTERTMSNLEAVLHDLGCDFEDLVCLTCYYVTDGELTEAEFLHLVAATLPTPARTCVVCVPVPCLAYEGLLVEIEGIAMRHPDGRRTARRYAGGDPSPHAPQQFCAALRSGKMMFVSSRFLGSEQEEDNRDVTEATCLEMNRIQSVLKQLDADCYDLVKLTLWHLGDLPVDAVEHALETCGSYANAPGPAVTATPVPRPSAGSPPIRLSAIAMRGENGKRFSRRYVGDGKFGNDTRHGFGLGLRCENMIFLGGQVVTHETDGDDISGQTHRAMQHTRAFLAELGAKMDDVCKVTTYYRADCGADALHANLPIRSSYFRDPGPTTTGIPLPRLFSDQALIAIEITSQAR